MRGEGIEQPLDWNQVREICQQIEGQLVNPTPTTARRPGRRKPAARMLQAVFGLVAIVVVLVLALRSRSQKPAPALAAGFAGSHPHFRRRAPDTGWRAATCLRRSAFPRTR